MSLGWQSESAILPSKAKPINVDSKSMIGLKALVYSEEQRVSNKSKDNIGTASSSSSGHRKGKKADIFEKQNKGVDERMSNIFHHRLLLQSSSLALFQCHLQSLASPVPITTTGNARDKHEKQIAQKDKIYAALKVIKKLISYPGTALGMLAFLDLLFDHFRTKFMVCLCIHAHSAVLTQPPRLSRRRVSSTTSWKTAVKCPKPITHF